MKATLEDTRPLAPPTLRRWMMTHSKLKTMWATNWWTEIITELSPASLINHPGKMDKYIKVKIGRIYA